MASCSFALTLTNNLTNTTMSKSKLETSRPELKELSIEIKNLGLRTF
jgi:hypothetical protein